MKRTYNLDFLVEVDLQDKRFCSSSPKGTIDSISEKYIVLDSKVYYKPYVQLFFSGNVNIVKYFNNFEDATKWAAEMGSYIKNKLII